MSQHHPYPSPTHSSPPVGTTNFPSKRPRPSLPPVYSPGELGKYAEQAAVQLAQLGWSSFIRLHQHPASLHPTLHHLAHPAAPYLHHLARRGVPAPSTAPPWSLAQRDRAYHRGAHPSASRQFAKFLLEDMFDYIHMGFWLVLPFQVVRHLSHLKLAPPAWCHNVNVAHVQLWTTRTTLLTNPVFP